MRSTRWSDGGRRPDGYCGGQLAGVRHACYGRGRVGEWDTSLEEGEDVRVLRAENFCQTGLIGADVVKKLDTVLLMLRPT